MRRAIEIRFAHARRMERARRRSSERTIHGRDDFR
jgi:hypothetical protein